MTRQYGQGSVFQRADGRWVGTIEDGYTASGGRRRIKVTADTEGAARTKLRKRQKELRDGKATGGDRTTIKAWADEWLAIKVETLRPKAYNAAASAVRQWIIPTIGRKRLTALTAADARAVEAAQRKAGLKGSTCHATHRTLLNMLRHAVKEGHSVPPAILLADKPRVAKSDRQALSIEETFAALEVASHLPHGTRWAIALLHGQRQAECLGLTWDAIDFDADVLDLQWQLQSLPYTHACTPPCGKKQARSCPQRVFRVPREYEARHLIDAWHLTRPKSSAGVRRFPLIPAIRDGLLAWHEIAPPNPWGLVFPTLDGRPANNKHDLEEWHALQCTAGIGHPGGRYYHVHEARNVTATALRDLGVDADTMTALMGHTSRKTTSIYTADPTIAAKRLALERVAALFTPGSDD